MVGLQVVLPIANIVQQLGSHRDMIEGVFDWRQYLWLTGGISKRRAGGHDWGNFAVSHGEQSFKVYPLPVFLDFKFC